MATLVIINGIVFSNPKFLFSEYKESLDIAEQNKDKCFVFVYDNFFNHIQDIPEMMIYKKSIIINTSREEEKYFIEDKELNNEDSFILCIKTYMDNDKIINELKEKTEFKNFTRLYSGGNSHEVISNNLYMVSK